MSNTIVLDAGSGGDSVLVVDMTSSFSSYPSTGGKLPVSCLYVSINTSTAPSPVTNANPLPVGDGGGSLTVDGTVAATQSGTWNVGTVTTITNVVHVDDNSGSLTVDGTVSVSGTVTVDSELTTADLDTGAGTDTRAVVGLALAESGGALLVGSAHPLPVSGTVTANAGTGTFATNVAQLAGTTTDTNSGTKSAGTLRVVLATDQPQLTNKLLVTPDANSAVNVAQVGGTAVDTNSGSKSAGTQRIVIATDQPQLTNALKVDGSAATQPVSVAAALAVGQRYDAAYNGTTAATPQYAKIDVSSSGDNTIVAASASKVITVLKWALWSAGAVNAKWRTSTGPTDLTGLIQYSQSGAGAMGSGAYCPVGHFQTTAGDSLKLNLSGAVNVTGYVVYLQV